jgi:hypothetical protein
MAQVVQNDSCEKTVLAKKLIIRILKQLYSSHKRLKAKGIAISIPMSTYNHARANAGPIYMSGEDLSTAIPELDMQPLPVACMARPSKHTSTEHEKQMGKKNKKQLKLLH